MSARADFVPPVPPLVRKLCPDCVLPGGECDLCNGNGYIFVSPYREGAGEQGDDFDDIKPQVKSGLGQTGGGSPPSPRFPSETFPRCA